MLSSAHPYCPWNGNPSPERFTTILPMSRKDFTARLQNIYTHIEPEAFPALDEDFVSIMVNYSQLSVH
jgi:hypothetical protein